VESSCKEFLALVNVFFVFVVEQGDTTTQNQETTKLMNCIVENLGVVGSGPSGDLPR